MNTSSRRLGEGGGGARGRTANVRCSEGGRVHSSDTALGTAESRKGSYVCPPLEVYSTLQPLCSPAFGSLQEEKARQREVEEKARCAAEAEAKARADAAAREKDKGKKPQAPAAPRCALGLPHGTATPSHSLRQP
jgi:hypothetical protein